MYIMIEIQAKAEDDADFLSYLCIFDADACVCNV